MGNLLERLPAGSKGPKTIRELTQLKLTRPETKEWYCGFKRDCPSGQLPHSDFKNIYSFFFPEGDAERFSRDVYRRFDYSGSGQIDFRLFMYALAAVSGDEPEDMMDFVYSVYDLDDNGQISHPEVLEIIVALYALTPPEEGGFAREKDEETGEEITAEKLTDMLFEKVDEDRDGFVTKEEFVPAAAAGLEIRLVELLMSGED